MSDIRALRQQRGWSQANLAQYSGVSHASVSKAELGKDLIPEMMQKILDTLAASDQTIAERPLFDCKAEREALHLTERELSRLSSVHERTIRNIERGRTIPALQTIERLKAGLRLAAEWQSCSAVSGDMLGSGTTMQKAAEERLTNADVLRRGLISNKGPISDSDLIRAGKVPCPQTTARCKGGCLRCKMDFLHRPYTGKE